MGNNKELKDLEIHFVRDYGIDLYQLYLVQQIDDIDDQIEQIDKDPMYNPDKSLIAYDAKKALLRKKKILQEVRDAYINIAYRNRYPSK